MQVADGKVRSYFGPSLPSVRLPCYNSQYTRYEVVGGGTRASVLES